MGIKIQMTVYSDSSLTSEFCYGTCTSTATGVYQKEINYNAYDDVNIFFIYGNDGTTGAYDFL